MVWGGDKISFTQGVVADRHRHQQVLHDVTNKYEDSLKEIQGVVGAGMEFVPSDSAWLRVREDCPWDSPRPPLWSTS